MTDFENFDERLRALAREVSRSLERVAGVDIEHIAEAIGVDPTRASELVDGAMGWLRTQARAFEADVAEWGAAPHPGEDTPVAPDEPLAGGPAAWATVPDPTVEPRRAGGPHPLDLPTDEQGLALAALDSGRWTVEPGSHVLVHGEGPGPHDAVGLVGELRARDWIAADGSISLAGRRALTRWLDGGRPA